MIIETATICLCIKCVAAVKAAGAAKGATAGAVKAEAVIKKVGIARHIGHLSLPYMIGGTIAVSTVGGATYLKVCDQAFKDLQKSGKRRGRHKLTKPEALKVLNKAYESTITALKAEGLYDGTEEREMRRIHGNCCSRLQSSGSFA